MKINKINLAFFISAACTFTLNIAMESPKQEKEEVETISIESNLNQANLANIPVKIKIKIINDIVNNVIEKNKNLHTIEVIKLIAKELLPLRQINKEFNNLIKFYVRNDLTTILISYGFKPLNIVDLLNQSTLSNTPIEIRYLILDNLVQNIIDSNNSLPVIDIIKSIAKELLPLRQINREFEVIIDDYISRRYGLSRALESNGIDINQKDTIGDTALISAIKQFQPELAKLIIQLGTNVNEKGEFDYTALIWAAESGYEDIVQLLIDKVDDVDERNEFEETALMLAARYGHKVIVELLISNGANVNEKNDDGNTALTLATRGYHEDIMTLLINIGGQGGLERSLLGLPNEVQEYIICQIIKPYEDKIKNVNNIFDYCQLDLRQLVSDLLGISLSSIDLRLRTLDLIYRLKKLKEKKYQELVNNISNIFN